MIYCGSFPLRLVGLGFDWFLRMRHGNKRSAGTIGGRSFRVVRQDTCGGTAIDRNVTTFAIKGDLIV
jgi:hypothetical protein